MQVYESLWYENSSLKRPVETVESEREDSDRRLQREWTSGCNVSFVLLNTGNARCPHSLTPCSCPSALFTQVWAESTGSVQHEFSSVWYLILLLVPETANMMVVTSDPEPSNDMMNGQSLGHTIMSQSILATRSIIHVLLFLSCICFCFVACSMLFPVRNKSACEANSPKGPGRKVMKIILPFWMGL